MSLRRILLLAAFTFAIGGQDVPPTLPAALAKLQSNDPAGAAEMLERLLKSDPTNGRAWRNLGLAYQALKDYPKAIAALRKSLEVEPSMVTPLFNLGVLSAANHDVDGAFEWLAKAKATRKIDMTQMEGAADLAPLRGDPRFSKLLPAAKDFEAPFTEPVKILKEFDGDASNDQFGWIARNIGDVDGDHVADFVTSAPTAGENAGRVYVYSTGTGKLLWSVNGKAGDQLGSGVEAAGDTNHDGIPDVIASAPGGGYATVYSGRDGRELFTVRADKLADRFGQHVSGAGDVDHDGFDDVFVGAPGANRAYVYSGKSGKLLATFDGEQAGDNFGSAVAGFTGKQGTLLVVGAPTAGTRKNGRVYVYDSLAGKAKFTIEADDTGTALGGMFVSVMGDVDGDGFPDVYASDWRNSGKGPGSGRVYVHSGKDGRRLLTLTGETPGEGFGTSASVAGDVDGDGHADLIVGSWQYSVAANGAGRAYLYSGKDGKLLKTYTCKIPGDAFGFDAVTLGDVDGDGMVDFLITSAWSGIHGFHSGRVFVISSGVKK